MVEAELELNVSENQDERPPATLQHNKRGKSTVTGEATPRIPAESHLRTGGTTGTGHEAERAHIIPASDNDLLPLCTGPAHGFTNSPFLCVIWSYERVADTAQIFLSQTIHMTQAEVAYGMPWGSTFPFFFFPSLQVANQWFNPPQSWLEEAPSVGMGVFLLVNPLSLLFSSLPSLQSYLVPFGTSCSVLSCPQPHGRGKSVSPFFLASCAKWGC